MLFYGRLFIVGCQHDCPGELFGTALLENKVSPSTFSGCTLGVWAYLEAQMMKVYMAL